MGRGGGGGGGQKPFKTQGFKKVLGLKVSGQGKLEFKSDLPTMLIKHEQYLRFCENVAPAAELPSHF